MGNILEKVFYFFLGIIFLVLIAVALVLGDMAIMLADNLIYTYPYETILVIIAVILLVILVRKYYINYKIKEVIKRGLGDSYTNTLYLVEKRIVSSGTYNIDMPFLNDIKDYFYNEYNLYPGKDIWEEHSEIIVVDIEKPIVVSKEHLWAMLSNKERKKRYYIYHGYKLLRKPQLR